jgi:hypothetical protein
LGKINYSEKVISIPVPLFTLLRTKRDSFVIRVYIQKNSPCFSACLKLARIVLTEIPPETELSVAVGTQARDQETGVGRYRKIGGSLEESARSAQRGLLVILASALVWVAVIWIGYHVLY